MNQRMVGYPSTSWASCTATDRRRPMCKYATSCTMHKLLNAQQVNDANGVNNLAYCFMRTHACPTAAMFVFTVASPSDVMHMNVTSAFRCKLITTDSAMASKTRDSNVYYIITGSAVALHCCKAHAKVNGKIEKFDPL